jgi:hypothetical protein
MPKLTRTGTCALCKRTVPINDKDQCADCQPESVTHANEVDELKRKIVEVMEYLEAWERMEILDAISKEFCLHCGNDQTCYCQRDD